MAAQTVVVACKIPNGLVCEFRGAVPEKYAAFVGRRVVLNGAKPRTVHHLEGMFPIVGGFGLTENIDSEFMAAWLELHADLPAVKNGLVFVQSNLDRARGVATDRGGLRSGYEPLSQKDLPRNVEEVDKAA